MISQLHLPANFFDVTIGQIATSAIFVIGVAMTWQRNQDAMRVMSAKQEKQDRKLDTLTVAAASQAVLNAQEELRLENYHRRIRQLEETHEKVIKIAADVEWIREAMKKPVNERSHQ